MTESFLIKVCKPQTNFLGHINGNKNRTIANKKNGKFADLHEGKKVCMLVA